MKSNDTFYNYSSSSDKQIKKEIKDFTGDFCSPGCFDLKTIRIIIDKKHFGGFIFRAFDIRESEKVLGYLDDDIIDLIKKDVIKGQKSLSRGHNGNE